MMGVGPGQREIYIRGAATEQSKNTVVAVQGSSPAVALYVDEQPVSLGGRNLDVYAADLNRIEVLPGPQGTLFGASSQSGTVRLITNKPDPTPSRPRKVGAPTKGGDIRPLTQAFSTSTCRTGGIAHSSVIATTRRAWSTHPNDRGQRASRRARHPEPERTFRRADPCRQPVRAADNSRLPRTT